MHWKEMACFAFFSFKTAKHPVDPSGCHCHLWKLSAVKKAKPRVPGRWGFCLGLAFFSLKQHALRPVVDEARHLRSGVFLMSLI